MKKLRLCKNCHCGLPLLREAVDRGWFFALLEGLDISWKYRRDGFSHRYKSENVVCLLWFAETAQAFLGEV